MSDIVFARAAAWERLLWLAIIAASIAARTSAPLIEPTFELTVGKGASTFSASAPPFSEMESASTPGVGES